MSGFFLALVWAAVLYVQLRGKLNFSNSRQSNPKVKKRSIHLFIKKNIDIHFLSVEAKILLP